MKRYMPFHSHPSRFYFW